MLALVLIALRRPYTFMVLGVVILIQAVIAAVKTPTDIFPAIGIPVVSVIWTYVGLAPDDMSGRVQYPYELALTTLVNDIEHIHRRTFLAQSNLVMFMSPPRLVRIASRVRLCLESDVLLFCLCQAFVLFFFAVVLVKKALMVNC